MSRNVIWYSQVLPNEVVRQVVVQVSFVEQVVVVVRRGLVEEHLRRDRGMMMLRSYCCVEWLFR